MKKSRLLIAAMLALVLLITACGGNGAAPPADPPAAETLEAEIPDEDVPEAEAPDEEAPAEEPAETPAEPTDDPVVIDIAWWGGEARHERFLTLLDMYSESFPHVSFITQYAGWGDYWARLTTQAAAGAMPDTFGMTSMFMTDFASRGTMRDLQPWVDSGAINIDGFSQGSIDGGSWNDTLYGITFGDTVSVLAFNKTLIESVGMELPWPDMTYSEFIAYATELSHALPDGVWGTTYMWEHQFENLTRNFGGQLVEECGTEVGFTEEVLWIFYDYLYQLLTNEAGPPADVMAENAGAQWIDSLEGNARIAVFQTNANQLKIWQAQMPDHELGMVRGLIADDAIYRYVEMPQPSAWTISTSSDIPDAVAHFINHFVNDYDMQRVWNMELGVPGSPAIQDMIVSELDDSLVANTIRIEIELVSEVLNNVVPHPGRNEGSAAVTSAVAEQWDEILFGRRTVDEAVEAFFNVVPILLGH